MGGHFFLMLGIAQMGKEEDCLVKQRWSLPKTHYETLGMSLMACFNRY